MTSHDDMRAVLRGVKQAHEVADSFAGDIASLIVGRLRRGVPTGTLARLKKELRDFNIHTGSWK